MAKGCLADPGADVDFPSKLAVILRKEVDALNGNVGIAALWNEREMRFVEGATLGLDSEAGAALRLFINETLPNLTAGRLVDDGNTQAAQESGVLTITREGTQDLIITRPLVIDGKTIGLICVSCPYLPRSFSNSEPHVRSFFVDIAAIALQNARLAAHLAEERFRIESILENSADGIMAIDTDRRITYFNAGMERITGWKREEAVGRYCFQVLKVKNGEGADFCQTGCPILEGGGGFIALDGVLSPRTGRDIDVSLSYSIARSPEGHLLSAVIDIHDVRHLRQLEHRRSALLATVSHELQTPISIIKAYASTLTRPDARWGQETIMEKLKAIEEESDRLSGVVSKLLYTSRLEEEGVGLDKLLLNLENEANRVAKRFAGVRENCGVRVGFPPDFPPVSADPEKVNEVLTNLVENAIKFSPGGGTVTITGEVSGKNALVAVVDRGIGIPVDEQERVFERFYRGKDSSVTRSQGTGLGLYICKTLIEAHGGRIWVESQPGIGSRFIFSLPIVEED
ncbi:MAG: ATP-binding protein [Dehalococcoidia bacterium]|nr:ATP-binding protein [Dehalococcoidia bacterium]